MKGRVHAAIGASAPVGLVATQAVDILQGAVMAGIAAGFSLLPDIDHPKATASTALGRPVHKAIHSLCKVVVEATALGRDHNYIRWRKSQRQDPYHRTLTHTLVAAVVMGLLAYGLAFTGRVATGAVAAFGVFLLWPLYRTKKPAPVKSERSEKVVDEAERGATEARTPARRRGMTAAPLVLLGAAAVAVLAPAFLDPWLIAVAVMVGYASHIVADGCTRGGVPALWPMRIQSKRWWNIRLLGGEVASGSLEERGPAVGVALASNVLLILLNM